ncbi:MAG: glycoside hydrolase family 32 protein [Clostridiales bacterium]|nr:glycoside hydrolase family 32 protein [Clostridiales bacterium]
MKKTFTLRDGYLHIPVRRDAKREYVRVGVDGAQIRELHIGLSAEPEFYCAMPLREHIGRTVELESDGPLDAVAEGGPMVAGDPRYPDLYRERFRPAYHFSSRRGWLNDPNGLFYDGERYHLYYQHNPYGILHGGVNIHWGHAVSPDAVHWTELDDAIAPENSRWHIASGSAIVDRCGAAGFGAGAVIAAYTALGSMDYRREPPREGPSFGQYLAYSVDGGSSFQPFPGNPRIATEEGKSWRDPRLFELPGGGFAIAVYETNGRGNCVSFYRSDDLRDWRRTARADDLYECPDLFELAARETGERIWVLYGADGMYRVGRFEDGAFVQTGPKQPMDYGDSTYAGQTWTGRADGDGRLHISWVRGMGGNNEWSGDMGYPGMPFSQCMSAPCLLTLHATAGGHRLRRNPAPALDALRVGEPETYASDVIPIRGPRDIELRVDAESPVSLALGRMRLRYDPADGACIFGGERTVRLGARGPLRARLLIDRTTVELFVMGEVSATYAMDTENAALAVCGAPGRVSARGWALRSIWP